ncbi:CKLF-like MARVEL transmembrane domain-containing protein 7 [Alosa pseudoharengus]|uniref:CKLF-like MARVEL transmembrane domain-containing protein 7 n=1 Tax=Alosa pseudoharengus TaxID=34774 RepID=UPI003F8CC979
MATDTEEVLNLKYLRSAQGILKITELVFLLAAFLVVRTSWFTAVLDTYIFFQVITIGVFSAIFLFLILTALGLPSRLPCISWSVTEFVLDTVALLCVFPVSCAAAVKSHDVNVLVAASMLGLTVCFLFAASIALSFQPLHSKLSPHISAEV